MALLQDLQKLIEQRQNALGMYKGEELFEKTAELYYMKRSLRTDRFAYESESNNAKDMFRAFQKGIFSAVENITADYKRRVELIYKKTGLDVTKPLPDITLSENPEQAADDEKLSFFIESQDISDEKARQFRNKFYENGLPVTACPEIDDTSFNGRSFAEHVRLTNAVQPLSADGLLQLISEKIQPNIPGQNQNAEPADPMEYIRINGMTIEEAWGKRYTGIEDPEQKKERMKADLLNAILHGFDEISVVRKIARKKNNGETELLEGGRIILVQSRKNLEKARNVIHELNRFREVFSQQAPILLEPGVAIYPSAQKYFDEMRHSVSKLSQKLNLENNTTSSYEDIKAAYNDYLYNARAFLSYQLMEMQMTKENYERSLQNGQNQDAEAVRETRARLENTVNKMNALNRLFEEHLPLIENRFNLVDTATKGLSVSIQDDPWKKKSDFTLFNLVNVHSQTAQLRGWNQNVLDTSRNATLPADLSWINDAQPFSPLNNLQFEQLLEIAEVNTGYVNRITNAERLLGLTDENGVTAEERLSDKGYVPRRDTFQSLFCMWLMSEKKMTLKQAAAIYKVHVPIGRDQNGNNIYPAERDTVMQYEKEFLDFCLEHPFDPNKETMKEEMRKNGLLNGPLPRNEEEWFNNLFREKQQESVREWMRIFQNSANTAGQYVLPDINYSDPAQVKIYADELNLIRGIGGDGTQECNRILDYGGYLENFNPRLYAVDCMGGEEKFYGVIQSFFHMQNLMDTVYRSPYGYEPRKLRMPQNIVEKAFHQENAGKIMSPFKGRKLGDVLNSSSAKVAAYNSSFTIRFKHDYIARAMAPNNNNVVDFANPDNDIPQLPAKEAVSYLFHQNEHEFANYAEGLRTSFENHSAENSLADDVSGNVLEARSKSIRADLKEMLLSLGNAESVQEFLQNKADGNLTGKELIAEAFRLMVPRNFHGDFLKEGFKDSDLFLIDGQKPSEVWGEKYRHIANPDLKEWLYRTELLKKIAEGQSEIKTRMFKYDSTGRFKEIKPIVLYENRENMERLVRNYKDYRVGKANLYGMLVKMREELISTQDDPDANFYSDERTGSELYQDFCLALKDVINTMENPQAKPSLLQEKIENLNVAAAKYGSAREGVVMGPQTDEGRLRLRNAWKLTMTDQDKYGEKVVLYLNGLRNGLNSNLLLQSPYTTAKDDITDIFLDRGIINLNEGLGGKTISLDGEEDKFCRERIEAHLKEVRESEQYRNRDAASEERQAAIKYLMGYYHDKTSEPLNGAPKRMLKMITAHKASGFWYDVDRLSKDPAFQRFMKEDPEGCIKKWESIEENAENKRKDRKEWIKRHLSDLNRSGLDYVSRIQGNDPRTPEQLIRENANNAGEMNSYYTRLTDLILAQILSANTNDARQIRSEIACGTITEENLRNQIDQSVRAQNLLTGRNLGRIDGRLESGQIAKTIAKAVRENMIQTRRNAERERERRIQQQTAGILAVIDVNHDGIIQPEEWNQFRQGTTLQIAEHANDTFNEAGRRILSALNVRVKVREEGRPDREEVRQVELNFERLIPSVGLSFDRVPSLQRNFILWTMGQKDMGFEDAVRLCNTVPIVQNGNVINQADVERADQLRYEFHQFVTEHPVMNQAGVPDDQIVAKRTEFTDNYKVWARIFEKATNHMKNYRLPDINYRNPEEVRQNIEMLCLLGALGTEIGQEIEKMFATTSLLSGEKVARDEIGDRTFSEIRSFWWNLSDCMRGVSKAFLPLPDLGGHSMDELYRVTMATALMREAAMDDLQNYKGYNLGEIADKAGKESNVLNHGKALDDLYTEYRANPNAPATFTMQETAEYLQGKADGTFAQKAKQLISEKIQNNKNEFQSSYLSDIQSFKNGFYNTVVQKNLREIVMNLPPETENDVSKMKEALDTVVPNAKGATLRDVINMSFHSLLTAGAASVVLREKGLKPTDLFMVDGAPFLQDLQVKWKYNGIENNALKEDLYRLELLKMIFKGNREINIRNFEVQNDKITETDEVCLFPAKEFVKLSVEGIREMKESIRDMHADLLAYKSKLQSSQVNPDANFVEGAEPEKSSKEYKELVKCLKKAIKVTENEGKNSTREKIESAFTALSEASNRYYNEHTGFFFGEPIQDYGKIRYHASADMAKDARIFINRFRRFMLKIAENTMGRNDKLLQDIDLETAEEQLLKIANIQGTGEELRSQQDCRRLYLNDELRIAGNTFLQTYGGPNLPESLLNIPEDNVRLAVDFMDRLRKKKTAENTAEYKDIRTATHPEDRIRDLATNEVFIRMYSRSKRDCLNRWEEIENRVSERIESNQNFMSRTREDYGSVSAFVAGFDSIVPDENGEKHRTLTVRQVASRAGVLHNGDAQVKAGMYFRLAEVVVRGILMSDTELGKRFRYEDVTNPFVNNQQVGFCVKMMRKLGAQFMQDAVLDNANCRDTIVKLESRNNAFLKEAENIIIRRGLMDDEIDNSLNAEPEEIEEEFEEELERNIHPLVDNQEIDLEMLMNNEMLDNRMQKRAGDQTDSRIDSNIFHDQDSSVNEEEENNEVSRSLHRQNADFKPIIKNTNPVGVNPINGANNAGGNNLIFEEENIIIQNDEIFINTDNNDIDFDNAEINIESEFAEGKRNTDFLDENLNGAENIRENIGAKQENRKDTEELNQIIGAFEHGKLKGGKGNKEAPKAGIRNHQPDKSAVADSKLSVMFLMNNTKKPAEQTDEMYLTLRKRAFIRVYTEETFAEKGMKPTVADMEKQENHWLTKEPFKTILDTMVKDNTNRELYDLIKNHKVAEEVARIQKGNPKPAKHDEEEMKPKDPEQKKNGPEVKPKGFMG